MISHRVLVVAEPFPGLDAERVADALARGLLDVHEDVVAKVARASVSAEELRSARAVVIAAAELDERTLAGSSTFELATNARQLGVPAYAVTAENALDLFDARMLDLQAVLQARTTRALTGAGRRLAALI